MSPSPTAAASHIARRVGATFVTGRRRLLVQISGRRRRAPVSTRFGFDRGLPVDRHFIEAFLDRQREHVSGDVLEVHSDRYARRFGYDLTSVTVVDIDTANEAATIHGDLAVPGTLPPASFDCAIVTQTLQYVAQPAVAVRELWQALRPGGTLLVTVPCLGPIDTGWSEDDRWRFTPAGLGDLVRDHCPGGVAEVEGYGNLFASAAFLYGLAADELSEDDLAATDARFPTGTAALVRKSPP